MSGTDTTPRPGARVPALGFIFVTLLIDVLGFGLIIPVLPSLVERLGGGGVSQAAFTFGVLSSVFGLMQFLFGPALGSLSDQYGRRPVLLLSLFFTALDYVLMALAPNLAWLFVGRVLSGITSASFSVASAYIADISAPEDRAKNFGIIGAAFGAGFVLGPAMGGLLGSASPQAPFWAAAGLTLLNALYGMFVLPESLAPENRRRFNWRTANPLGTLTALSRENWVLVMAGALAVLGLAQQSLQNTWVLSNTLRFGWNERDNGLTLALLGAASIVVQMLVLPNLVRRFGEARTLAFGLAFEIIGFVGFAIAGAGWQMIVFMLLWTLSFVVGPTTQSLISNRFGPDEQGALQGGLTSIQSLMGVAGPLLATAVFRWTTAPGTPVYLPSSPFILGAGLTVVSGLLAMLALRVRRDAASAAA